MRKLIFLLPILLLFGCSNANTIISHRGRIKLSDITTPQEIKGDVAFYPWEVLTEINNDPKYIEIPKFWKLNPQPPWPNGGGYGTYQWTITIPDHNPLRPLGLELSGIHTAYRLYFDSIIQGKGGVFSTIPHKVIGETSRKIFPLPEGKKSILLSIEVANHADLWGGITKSPRIGYYEDLNEQYYNDLVTESIFLGVLFLLIVYHFLFYMVNKRDKTYLFFSLFALTVFIRVGFSGIIPFSFLGIPISWEIQNRGYYLSIYGLVLFGFLFFSKKQKELYSRRVALIQLTLGSLFCLIPMSLPISFMFNSLLAFEIYALVGVIYIIRNIVLYISRKNREAYLQLATLIPVFLAGLLDSFSDLKTLFVPSLLNFTLLVFILGQSFNFTLKIITALREAKIHEQDLQNDVTKLKKSKNTILKQNKRLNRMAHFDVLTGLPNRISLTEVFQKEINRAKRSKKIMGLIFMDLNNFKEINDNFGHETGDAFLKQFAARFLKNIRASDYLFRLAGDEFVLILNDIAEIEQIENVARKVNSLFQIPFTHGEFTIKSSISMGISLYPEHGESMEELTHKADLAMYRNKRTKNKDGYIIYNADIDRGAKIEGLNKNIVHKGFHENQFRLHYQPMLNFKDSSLWGTEVLVRWEHPEKGILFPGSFLPFLEESGLILTLGNWILSTAFSQIKELRNQGFNIPHISINLSTFQFSQPGLPNRLEKRLSENGIAAKDLWLEIRESTLFSSKNKGLDQLRELKKLGFHILIDGFGAEYFSYNYLRDYPIEGIKLGHDYIRSIETNSNDMKIIESMIQMSEELGFDCIIEGIERETQANYFKGRNIIGQGYYLSHPIPSEEFKNYLQNIKKGAPV